MDGEQAGNGEWSCRCENHLGWWAGDSEKCWATVDTVLRSVSLPFVRITPCCTQALSWASLASREFRGSLGKSPHCSFRGPCPHTLALWLFGLVSLPVHLGTACVRLCRVRVTAGSMAVSLPFRPETVSADQFRVMGLWDNESPLFNPRVVIEGFLKSSILFSLYLRSQLPVWFRRPAPLCFSKLQHVWLRSPETQSPLSSGKSLLCRVL